VGRFNGARFARYYTIRPQFSKSVRRPNHDDMRNPLQSTGWLTVDGAASEQAFLGSCFAFRRTSCLLTAAHCVRGYDASALRVHTYHENADKTLRVQSVMHHPKADVALLWLTEHNAMEDRFAGDTSLYDWGIPVSAFGYPEDTGRSGLEPTARYFRGNIQRYFTHSSHLGYEYEAVELSFGAPAGLSGGPVTPGSDYAMAMGIVVENLTSTTYLATVTEEVTESTSRVEKIHHLIHYAIAVRLDPLTDWLDEQVPYHDTGV
jgi:hypothetical protein